MTLTFFLHIIKALAKVKKLVGKKDVDIILGGDLNIDYSTDSKARKRLGLVETAFSLQQYINSSTRPLYSDAVLDLILTNINVVADIGLLDINGP